MPNEPAAKSLTRKHQARAKTERTQRKFIVWGAAAVFILVFLTISYGLLDQYVLKDQKPVATVNGEKITVKDFQNRVKYTRWQLVQQYVSNLQIYQMLESSSPGAGASFAGNLQQILDQLNVTNTTVLGESVLDQMIESKLISQKASEMGITVSEKDVDSAIEEAFGFFPDGTPTPEVVPTQQIVSTSTLSPQQLALIKFTATPTAGPTATNIPTTTPTETITEVSPTVVPTQVLQTSTPVPSATPYTLEGYQLAFNEYLSTLKSEINFSEEDLRGIVLNSLLAQKVMDSVTSDLQPVEEQVWARHILLADETVAKVMVEQLKNGEDWYKLAAESSLDTSNKDIGGDLGWFGKGSMVAPFEEAAFALNIGEISEPVKTDFGWHIIQVLGKEERPITQTQLDNLRTIKFNEWLQDQKEQSTIEKNDIWLTSFRVNQMFPRK